MKFLVRRSWLLVLLPAWAVLACAQQPVGEVFASDATVQGSVQLTGAGATVMSGASVTAGDAAARLKLARGGNVRVCPQTSISVSASGNGSSLMLGLGTGALETDYKLATSADTIVTPDFRILLPGPGRFQFAVRNHANGDTCIQARGQNTSSLVVSEVMGDATYQVKPNEHVLFRKGRIAEITADPAEDCGCPPSPERLRAADQPEAPKAAGLMANPPAAAEPPSPSPETSPGARGVQVEVDTPFVFRAEDMAPRPAETGRESLASLPAVPEAEALPPPPPVVRAAATTAPPTSEPKKKRGAFSRFKAFLASIFK
jgi:hypothetical protein